MEEREEAEEKSRGREEKKERLAAIQDSNSIHMREKCFPESLNNIYIEPVIFFSPPPSPLSSFLPPTCVPLVASERTPDTAERATPSGKTHGALSGHT